MLHSSVNNQVTLRFKDYRSQQTWISNVSTEDAAFRVGSNVIHYNSHSHKLINYVDILNEAW